MEYLQEIAARVDEKRELFLRIEQVSERMREASADELAELFAERGELLEQVQALDENIKELAKGDESILAALANKSEPETLEGDLKKIFEASMKVKAIANRVANGELIIKEHIEAERDGLREKIEEMNASSQSVAGSYMRSVKTGYPQSLLNKRPKTI